MRRLLPAALLLLLLAGCTGTQSPQAPRLLFVTHELAGEFIAALIREDRQAPSTGERLDYLEASERVLPGEPRAMDMVDRAGSRSQVVLLLEEAANDYSALWLDVQDIEPGNVTSLAELRYLELTPLLLPLLAEPSELCLSDLQVNRTGDVLGLFNDPQLCGGSVTDAQAGVFIVDVAALEARSLAASDPLVSAGVFIRQGQPGSDSDLLHFLDEGVGSVRLNSVELPDGAVIPGTQAPFASGSDNPEPGQLTFSDAAFIARQPAQLQLLKDGSTSSISLPSGRRADLVIADPAGDYLQALLVLQRSPGRLFVYGSGESSEPSELTVSSGVSDASVDPYGLWVYVLRSGGVDIVDLLGVLEGTGTSPAQAVSRFSLPPGTLGTPGFISWVDGVLPPPEP